MNAIDTLRQVVAEHGFQATNPMLSTLAGDALAKLDTLLQAAERVTGPTGYTSEDIRALAAAVRDAKGDTT